VTAFDEAIAVAAHGAGERVTAQLDGAWSTPAGLNGGYIAAVVLNAITTALATPERPPRSITLHYLAAPAPGPADIEVVQERAGRSLTSASARLTQDGRTRVLALASLAGAYDRGVEFATPAPEQPAFADVDPITRMPPGFPMVDFLEFRPALGPLPFLQPPSAEAMTGGWLSLKEARPVDAPLLALLCDAWWPALYVREPVPVAVPTIDLTIHFRAPEAAATLPAGTPLRVRFTSQAAHEGLIEEDGELWAPDGTLLATSRQLAVQLPARP
jgi:acyl-CoA thioesterase